MNAAFASLSLTHLRTLECLLQLKNLSHAAQRLGCSQSALSRQLAHLRQAFADPLLVRQGRGYGLSETAEQLLLPSLHRGHLLAARPACRQPTLPVA